MIRSFCILMSLLAVILSGCSGTRYEDASEEIPSLKPEYGRLILYGTIVQRGCFSCPYGIWYMPGVQIDGNLMEFNRGFRQLLVIDRPAGSHVISAQDYRTGTELERDDSTIEINISPGETKYIKMKIQKHIVHQSSSEYYLRTFPSLSFTGIDPDEALNVEKVGDYQFTFYNDE